MSCPIPHIFSSDGCYGSHSASVAPFSLSVSTPGGKKILPVNVAFEISGPVDGPVVIVQGGISAHKHVYSHAGLSEQGWWDAVVGPGLAIDSNRFRVLSIDYLGGQGQSSGPLNDVGFRRLAPRIATSDQAQALAAVLDHLGIKSVHAFVGASYGGMIALSFAALFPQRVEQIVVLSAAHNSHPQSTALRRIQQRIVELGMRSGDCSEALSLARELAMVTYRSPEEFAVRFSGPPASHLETGLRFPVEDYLESRGKAYAARFSPEVFLTLSSSINAHCVDPSCVVTPATLFAVTSDQLVPLSQMKELASGLRGPVRLVEHPSLYGHDAFLKEIEAVSRLLRQCL